LVKQIESNTEKKTEDKGIKKLEGLLDKDLFKLRWFDKDPRDKLILIATRLIRFFYLSVYFYWMPFVVFIFNWILTVIITNSNAKDHANTEAVSRLTIYTTENMKGWDPKEGGSVLYYLDAAATWNMTCLSDQPAAWKWTWSGYLGFGDGF